MPLRKGPERRKGQRRKGNEIVSADVFVHGGVKTRHRVFFFGGKKRNDRRSGQDRRKKS